MKNDHNSNLHYFGTQHGLKSDSANNPLILLLQNFASAKAKLGNLDPS